MGRPAVILAFVMIMLAVALAAVLRSRRAVKRWHALVERELKRRSLVRVPSSINIDVDPADGYQLIETCACERNGTLHDVVFFVRRRSLGLVRLVVEEIPAA